jgi:hypothetical protein
MVFFCLSLLPFLVRHPGCEFHRSQKVKIHHRRGSDYQPIVAGDDEVEAGGD